MSDNIIGAIAISLFGTIY